MSEKAKELLNDILEYFLGRKPNDVYVPEWSNDIEAYIADLEAENEKLLQQQANAEMNWSTALNILDVDGECTDSAKDGDLIRLAQKVMGENVRLAERQKVWQKERTMLLEKFDICKICYDYLDEEDKDLEVNKLRNENMSMRERLALTVYDPKENLPEEDEEVLVYGRVEYDDPADDWKSSRVVEYWTIGKWRYDSRNDEPRWFDYVGDEIEPICWQYIPDRPQSGGEQE